MYLTHLQALEVLVGRSSALWIGISVCLGWISFRSRRTSSFPSLPVNRKRRADTFDIWNGDCTSPIHGQNAKFRASPFLGALTGVPSVCARISVISYSISKIQRPIWRARQDDSYEPSHISTAWIKQSVGSQTLIEERYVIKKLKTELLSQKIDSYLSNNHFQKKYWNTVRIELNLWSSFHFNAINGWSRHGRNGSGGK